MIGEQLNNLSFGYVMYVVNKRPLFQTRLPGECGLRWNMMGLNNAVMRIA